MITPAVPSLTRPDGGNDGFIAMRIRATLTKNKTAGLQLPILNRDMLMDEGGSGEGNVQNELTAKLVMHVCLWCGCVYIIPSIQLYI